MKVLFGLGELILQPEAEWAVPVEAHVTIIIALGPREARMVSLLVQLKLQDLLM